MIEREEVRSIVQEVLEEEHLHNFTKIFEKEHNLFRGTHDKMAVPPAVVENYYTQTEIEGMTHWRKDDDDIYYDDGYIGAGVLTEGSVLFVGADGKIIQDNTKAYWHNASKQLNIGDYDISGVDDFEDNFEEDTIGASWTTHNTDADRTIDVDTPNTLTIAIAASTDGRWVSSVNEAPKLYKSVSSPPFEFVVKMPAQSLTNNNTAYGAFIGYYDATQTNGKPAYKFTNMRAGDGSRYIQVNRVHGVSNDPPTEGGSDEYSSVDTDAILWFKIAVDESEDVRFYVSDDLGSSWFQMERGSVAYAWSGFFASDMQVGLVATTMSSTNAAITAQFGGTTIEVLDHNAIIAERFKLTDSDLSHLLKLKWNEDDSADRTLDLKVEGGDRTIDLYENLTIGNGYDVTITALGQANTFTMNEGFTIGNGHAGTLTYSVASKTLTVEDDSLINQDLTTDASGVQFTSLNLVGGNLNLSGASAQYVKIDSNSTAIFIADAHDADAYLRLEEDNVIKWTVGFDYSNNLKFKISEGIPGTNTRLEIPTGGSMNVFDTGAGHIQITAQSSGAARLMADSYTNDAYVELQEQNVLKWCAGFDYTDSNAYVISEGAPGVNNRLKIASGGDVDILSGNLSLYSNNELRFYDNGNYVGFEAPALDADQIWALPTADGNANEFLNTNGSGTLDWAGVSRQTGWPTTQGVTLSFADGNRTFTVTDGGSAYYYIQGTRYTLGGNKTVVIDDTEGLWFIYFSGSTLTASQTPWTILSDDKALVAYVHWDATNNKAIFFGHELHTFWMDNQTHARLHFAGGASWEEGLLVSDAGSEDINVSAGDMWDEDLEIEITDGAGAALFEQVLSPAELPIYYLDGASNWRIYETTDKANATDAGYVDVSNDLKYNKLNGTWANATVGTGKHVAYYVVATNEQTEPVALIMGQRIDNNLADAKENNLFSGLTLTTLPFQEMIVLARLILKDTGTGVYYTLEDVVDLRNTNITGNITSPLITDHGGLGGLGDDDHQQYIKDVEFTQDSGVLVGTGAGTFAEETGNTLRTSLGLTIGTDVAAAGANSDITSMSGITGTIATPTNLASKTTGTWRKSIGSGGDYADWNTMLAAMPDLIAHTVTIKIEVGTVLTEECDIRSKHGITSGGLIQVIADKYYPTGSTAIPTADGSGTGADTMQDTSVFDTNDEYNNCWVMIVDGTGTDNPPTQITDTVAADGEIFVAAWAGTQPDATSRYIIVGALIDGEGSTNNNVFIQANTCPISFYGIGFYDADNYGVYIWRNPGAVTIADCGVYGADLTGVYLRTANETTLKYCGLVNNNTSNNSGHGGIYFGSGSYGTIYLSGISDNLQRGIYGATGAHGNYIADNFGDNNGTWGSYAENFGVLDVQGVECSGSSGNHSDSGTAGTASADQAVVF